MSNASQKLLFIVDDSDTNLTMAADALVDAYRVITLPSAMKMFDFLKKQTPNLILLDVDMPVMNGFEAIRQLKAHPVYAQIPVIFLTALDDSRSEVHGIELGAVDFITKPFSKTVLRSRLKTHLNIDSVIQERTMQLQERTRQLLQLHNSIVFTLADLVESRDENTGGHIERTTAYIRILAEALLQREVYADTLQHWNMDTFVSSARLHDVGKILVPDSILNKPGPLSEEEFALMKVHPAEGERIISQMIKRIGESEFLSSARLTAAFHHERWDGKGYPYGLPGRDIPLEGRIMAIVDVYDALTSVRPYKKAFSSDEAYGIILKDSGRHFDPQIAGVFEAVRDRIEVAQSRSLLAV